MSKGCLTGFQNPYFPLTRWGPPPRPSQWGQVDPKENRKGCKRKPKEIQRGSKWNKQLCLSEASGSFFCWRELGGKGCGLSNCWKGFLLIDGSWAEKEAGFSPWSWGLEPSSENRFRHWGNFRHGNCCRRLAALMYSSDSLWVKLQTFEDGVFSPHLCV